MTQTLIYTTDNNNSYIYDDESRLSMLIHPKLKNVYQKSKYIDPYYLRKYEYLKKHNFFTKEKMPQFEEVNESMIKESIINTTQIIFEVTNLCNLKCTYCGYGELYEVFDSRNNNNIEEDKAKKLLKYIYDLKIQNNKNKLIIGFYGGEPLLNINFIQNIIVFMNQLNTKKEINVTYSMTTNAVLIDKYIDFLVDNKFEILISLDGNEKNHSYRVYYNKCKNSFEKVIENVDMIQRDYPEYFIKYVGFNAVLHNRNSVKEIYQFIYGRYHKIPEISELLLCDIKADKKELFDKMYHNKRISEANYQKDELNKIPEVHYESLLFDELKDFLKQLSINYYISNITSLLNVDTKYFPADTCLPFSLKIFLTAHNKLLPCERINQKYFLGEVNETVLIDIPKIVERYNSYYNHLKKVCQNCYAYKFCGVCIFRIKNIDKLDVEEFVCDRFYDQKSFGNDLSRIFSFLEEYPEDFLYVLKKA